jgi:hypothetical protein
MPVQFSGTLEPGQYQEWFTYGWSPEYFVQWSVRPRFEGGLGPISLRALAVEWNADDGTLTYYLTVWNVGSEQVIFDAVYSETTTAQTIIDDPSGAYELGPGQSINLSWDFGVAPTLLNLIAIPQFSPGSDASFECSTPSVELNADSTAAYTFSVTNTGSQAGEFRMRAGLT